MAETSNQQIFIDLEPGSEWRFELEADENIAARVQSPNPVFINSDELPPVTWYPLLRHLKSSIYAPSYAKLEVSALPISQYTSTSTTQPQLVALHLALERQRILAKRHISGGPSNGQGYSNGTQPITRGPRVMVLGPPSSGKTTVVKNLINMALSSGMGWSVGVAGLDPASPANLIPGSLSLSTPSDPLPTHHLAHPLGSPPGSVPSSSTSADVSTLGWWFGHLEPTTRGTDVWRKLVTSVGEAWTKRCDKDVNALASGLIVDTSSAFINPMLGTRKDDPKARYSLVAQAIDTFSIDTLVVIGHEKLTIDLERLLSPRGVRVIRFPKSPGAVDLDDAAREIAHAQQVRAYFYGEPSIPREFEKLMGRMTVAEAGFSPYSFQIGWDTLTVLRVGEENAAPSTALPLGSSRILSPTRLTRVDPSGPAHVTRLLNTVLAIVAIDKQDRIPKIKPEATTDNIKIETQSTEAVDVKIENPVDNEDGQPAEEGEGEQEEEAGDAQEQEDAEDEDEVPYIEEVGWREVLGFIVITGIDHQKKKYTVLAPSPGRLPSTVALAGSIEWVDTE
ncbi:hypothetical protein BCR39DRAFT_509714 [Naematelia encephala]|uniref:Polynucleotide 5'-hydroxyl-kinase GRC3 n=1 Tax=Naematelia encephala TaxID=71784 RepID=A0A1Y2BKY7_9TREE|nr:hypothetical protein BCR39DRAFT_509714 [Naematelia encephala]